MTSHKAQVDDLIFKFEKSAERHTSLRQSVVKRKAAETDLLKVVELARDLLQNAVKSDRDMLVQVFGGSCERFWRFQRALDSIDSFESHPDDPRWEQLKDAMLATRHVLEDLGTFKPWLINMTAPKTLSYEIPGGYLETDSKIRLTPMVDGCEIGSLSFLASPPLPDGLDLDTKNGEISGQLADGVQSIFHVGDECQAVACVNVTTSKDPSNGVLISQVPPGTKSTLQALDDGDRIKVVTGGVQGWISLCSDDGTPLVVKIPNYVYTIIASNNAGAASFDLELCGPAPASFSYRGVNGNHFECFQAETMCWQPVVEGGSPTTWSVQPPLPEGIELDSRTGILYGTPLRAAGPTTYEITAANACGSATVSISLCVIAADSEEEMEDSAQMPAGHLEAVADGSSSESVHYSSEECCAEEGSMINQSHAASDYVGSMLPESEESSKSSRCAVRRSVFIEGDDQAVLDNPGRVIRLEWRKNRREEHSGWTSHSVLQARLQDGKRLRVERFSDLGCVTTAFEAGEAISNEGVIYKDRIAKIHEIQKPLLAMRMLSIAKDLCQRQPYSLRRANCHHFVRDLWNRFVIKPLQCNHHPDRIKGSLLRGATKPFGFRIFSRNNLASTSCAAKPPAEAEDSDDELAAGLCRLDLEHAQSQKRI